MLIMCVEIFSQQCLHNLRLLTLYLFSLTLWYNLSHLARGSYHYAELAEADRDWLFSLLSLLRDMLSLGMFEPCNISYLHGWILQYNTKENSSCKICNLITAWWHSSTCCHLLFFKAMLILFMKDGWKFYISLCCVSHTNWYY